MKMEEERALQEIKTEFSNNTSILSSQMGNFINTVAPYLIAPDCKELRNEDSAKYLNSMTFFRLKSCTTENVDDLAQIFAGISKSIETRKQKVKEEKEWADVMEMPNIGE